MNTKPVRSMLVLLSLVILLANTPFPVSASGNTFLSADLRIDLPAVKTAGDFRVKIAAVKQPTTAYPSYTAGWLGIDLDQQSSGKGTRLTQIGLMADQTGVYWFAYSQAPIRCLQGTPAWWDEASGQFQGCKGEAFQIVHIGFFHTVELVNYGQGEWIARMFDTNEIGHDVAVITYPGTEIYDADINFEEAYIQEEDPYLDGAFVFYRPQYNTWDSVTGFVDWPSSQNVYKNYLYPDGLNAEAVCPTHYAVKPMYTHPRAWYTGPADGAADCSTSLFNEFYLPAILMK